MQYDGYGISKYCNRTGTDPAVFHGYRLDCAACDRPFRSFRSDETHCGCCRHLKASPASLAS